MFVNMALVQNLRKFSSDEKLEGRRVDARGGD